MKNGGLQRNNCEKTEEIKMRLVVGKQVIGQ